MYVKLSPLADQSEKPKENKFIVCDIETANWTRFLVIGVFDGRNVKTFTSIRTFLRYIFARYQGFDCFAHFGGRFDFLFILQEILKDDEFTVQSMVPRGSGFLYIDVTDGDSVISFRDSSALLPFSLKRITENFGVEHGKLEIDYTKITRVTKKLLRYLTYDLKGLYESLEKFYNSKLIKKAGPTYTLASQSLRLLRTYLKEPIWFLSQDLDYKIRPAYLGGRTEIFKPYYKGREPLYCYDVNSLYPFVMRENTFPNNFEYETYEFYPKKHGFYHAIAYIPKDMYIPPLGVVKNGKYIFATGKVTGFWSTAEINYAKTLGIKFKIQKGYVFSNAGYLFRDFINDLYAIRQKSEKTSVDNILAKLLMNSCYGRFGLNLNRENIVFDDGSVGLQELREIKVGLKTYRLMTKEVKLESFNNVAIAAYVTAYARIHMHKIYQVCGKALYYTDTDSLFTTKRFKETESLGGLKLEYSCKNACFLLPKTYIAGRKIVMKGFDKKKIQGFTIDDFYECLEGDLKSLKITEEPKFATFKTAIKQGQLVTMTKGGSRQIRSQYDKRIIFKRKDAYDTKPIEIV